MVFKIEEEINLKSKIINEIRSLLEKAEKAHHLYEQKFLNGNYDKNWADWYSRYLIKEGLNEYVPNLSFKILTNFLKESNKEILKLNNNFNWAEYVSEKIYEKFLN